MYTYQLMPIKQEVPTNHHHIPSYCKNAVKSSCEHDIKLQFFVFFFLYIGKLLFILSIFENNGNDLYAVIFFFFLVKKTKQFMDFSKAFNIYLINDLF